MKASLSFITVCQQASCLLADFDTVLRTWSGLNLSEGSVPMEPQWFDGSTELAEVELTTLVRHAHHPELNRMVEARRAHCSRFVNYAGKTDSLMFPPQRGLASHSWKEQS